MTSSLLGGTVGLVPCFLTGYDLAWSTTIERVSINAPIIGLVIVLS